MDTPIDIDTMIDRLERDARLDMDKWHQLIDLGHTEAGDIPLRRHPGRRPSWSTSDSAMTSRIAARAKFSPRAARILAALNEITADAICRSAAISELQSVYWQNPWARYYRTTGPNARIHRSRACCTCRHTTRYEWLVQHSGQDPADVVEQHGPLLCRACFRDVPDEWTKRRQHCTGAHPVPNTIMRWPSGSSGTCPVCRRHVRLKTGDIMIKHPAAEPGQKIGVGQ